MTNVSYRVRLMKPSDAIACAMLDKSVRGADAQSFDEYIGMISNRSIVVIVAVDEMEQPIGVLMSLVFKSKLVVVACFVDRGHRLCKAGTNMLDKLFSIALNRMTLYEFADVLDGEEYARQAFLAKMGYRMVRLRRAPTQSFFTFTRESTWTSSNSPSSSG